MGDAPSGSPDRAEGYPEWSAPHGPLHAIIRRGKRRDRVFAVTGAVLIFASLATLGVLIADLVRDGAPTLFHSHPVKESGYPPSFLTDLTGRLKKQAPPAPGGQPTWLFEPDALPLNVAALPDSLNLPEAEVRQRLAALRGQRVLIDGLPPDPGSPGMAPAKLEPLPADAEAGKPGARIRRNEMVGKLEAKGQKWSFLPEPLTLDTSEVATPLDPYEGERVAVTKKPALRREVGKLAVIEVQGLRSKTFLTSMPARNWYEAGILAAMIGTLLVMVVTLLTALPLGVAAGIYLEEYGRKNWLTAIVEVNIANLAGVPSIIWGLLGLGLFVYFVGLGHSVLTAGLTLGLLVLPIVIIATREAIRAVPMTMRDASIALGATKWQTVRHHVLPYSMSGILTGSIVALSRAIGETAPLIVVGAVVFLDFLPPPPLQRVPAADAPTAAQVVAADAPAGRAETEWRFQPFAWLRSPFTVLPIQMFNWTSRPEPEFHHNAAAAGLVLIVMTLSLNSLAIYLRARLRKRIKW